MPVSGYRILRPTLMCGISSLRVSFRTSDKDIPVISDTSAALRHNRVLFMLSHLLLNFQGADVGNYMILNFIFLEKFSKSARRCLFYAKENILTGDKANKVVKKKNITI